MDVETLINMAGSARELGARLGVARTTVLDWKRSQTIPGNRVRQIAEEFGIPADELVKIVQPPRSNGGASAAQLPSEAA